MKRRLQDGPARGAWTTGYLLVSSLSLLAACTGSETVGEVRDKFTANTSEGIVLVRVEGMATGITNSELTRLIRRGVVRIYPVRCNPPPDISTNAPQMVWHVIKDGRKPTAMVTVEIIRDGRIVRSNFANVSAPHANPDAVFIREVSELAYRLISPAAAVANHEKPVATGCRD
jgi:hypothetical protein